ncbi:MAG: restriction endonuclease subunit S [Alphaproteobacteria bacterium]|nr:restriction endonuclease subunit S [Alphaproteobacteria bacterium]
MTDWQEVKLGDIATITMGQSPKSEFYNSTGKGLPFLQGNRTFGLKYPTFDTYTTNPTKIAEAGDIIMSVRAPVGDLNITPQKICLGRGVCSLRMKNGDQAFLYYLMKYNNTSLLNRESGTIFGSVNKSDIESLIVNIPNGEVQKKIAGVLGALDDKIELNNKINQNLELQAQALFKSWFVDFEPFGGTKPSDWKEIQLSEIADFIGGYSYKGTELRQSLTAMATIKNFDRNGGFKLDGYKEIEPSAKLKRNQYVELFDTLVAHTDLTQNAEVIGNAEMLLTKGKYKDIIISMDVVKVMPKNGISKYLLAAILKDSRFKQHCLGYVNGTTVLHLSKRALPEYGLIFPKDVKILDKISCLFEDLYKKIALNIEENMRLSGLRDTLLPKLMSGEINVDNVDISQLKDTP